MTDELLPLTKKDLQEALISNTYAGETSVLGHGYFNFVIEEPGDPARARKYLYTPGVIPADHEQGPYRLDEGESKHIPTGTFSRFLYDMPRINPTQPQTSVEAIARYIKTEFGESDDRALATAVGREKTGLCQITNELFVRAKVGLTRCLPKMYAVVTKPAYDALGNEIIAHRVITEIPPDGPSVELHEQLTDMLIATREQENVFVSMETLSRSALEQKYPVKYIFEETGMKDMFRALEEHADFIIKLGQEGIMNFDKYYFFPVPNDDGFRLVTFDWGNVHKIPVDDFLVKDGKLLLRKHHYGHIINRYQEQIAAMSKGLYNAQQEVQGDRDFTENIRFIQSRLDRLRDWLVVYQDFTYPVDDMAQLAEERVAAATSLFSPFFAGELTRLTKKDLRDQFAKVVAYYRDVPGFPKDLVLAWSESVLNIVGGAAYLPELRNYRATLRHLRVKHVGDVSSEAEIILVGNGETLKQPKPQASESFPSQISDISEFKKPESRWQVPIPVRELQEKFPRPEYYFEAYDQLVEIEEVISTLPQISNDILEKERLAAYTDLLGDKLGEFIERARAEMMAAVDKRDLEDISKKIIALHGFNLPLEVKQQITRARNAMSNYFDVKDTYLHPIIKNFNTQIDYLPISNLERNNEGLRMFSILERDLRAAYEEQRGLLLSDELVEDRLEKYLERCITRAKEQLRENGIHVV